MLTIINIIIITVFINIDSTHNIVLASLSLQGSEKK